MMGLEPQLLRCERIRGGPPTSTDSSKRPLNCNNAPRLITDDHAGSQHLADFPRTATDNESDREVGAKVRSIGESCNSTLEGERRSANSVNPGSDSHDQPATLTSVITTPTQATTMPIFFIHLQTWWE